MPSPQLPTEWHEAIGEFFQFRAEIRRPTPAQRSRLGSVSPVDTSDANPVLTNRFGERYDNFYITLRPVSTTRGEAELPRATIPRSAADATAKANLRESRSGDILVVYENTDTDPVSYNILNVVVRQELDMTVFRLERIIEKHDVT